MKTKKIMLIAIIAFNFQLSAFNCFSQTLEALTDTNVIFHDYIPDVVVSNPYTDTLRIDINQDGINDLQFYIQYYPATTAHVTSLNNGCKTAFFHESNTNDSLASNALVWVSGDRYWASFFNYQNRLAVRITDGVNSYYGWVHVSYSIGPMFTIDKYAFCKIPNYPFLYGQTEISTGIPKNTSSDNVKIYTSASGGSVFVESEKQIKSVTITNTSGVMVANQKNTKSNNAEISITGLAHGVYIVKVQFTDSKEYTKQIVL